MDTALTPNSSMSRIDRAAQNNALWISRVCRTHRCSDQFRDACWLSFDHTPPLHPNAVTLGDANRIDLHFKVAKELCMAGIQESFALKDSFRALDLHDLGYQILFDSQWIYKESAEIEEMDCSGIEWSHIATPAALIDWEKSWAKGTTNAGIFLPNLLDDKDVLFIAAYQEDQIIAGCIANLDAGCVGISNIFLPEESAQQYRRSAVLEIQRAFPGLPLVGYETASDLADMQRIGFEAIGWLRVWFYESKVMQ